MIEYLLIQSGKAKTERPMRIIRAKRNTAKEIPFKFIAPTMKLVQSSNFYLLATNTFEQSYNLYSSLKELLEQAISIKDVLAKAASEKEHKYYLVSINAPIDETSKQQFMQSDARLLKNSKDVLAIKLYYTNKDEFNSIVQASYTFQELNHNLPTKYCLTI